MSIGSGADQILQLKDGQQKAGIANLEAQAASHARFRDIAEALSTAETSRRIRNELIAGILALFFIVAFVSLLFFVIA
jgi:hypothetical protein